MTFDKNSRNGLGTKAGQRDCLMYRTLLIVSLLVFYPNAAAQKNNEGTSQRNNFNGSSGVSKKTSAVPYFHIDFGAGLFFERSGDTKFDDDRLDNEPFPIISVNVGIGAFFERFGLEANFRYTSILVVNAFYGYTVLSYFSEGGNDGWFARCGLGYFYQRFLFDSSNQPKITQGIPFVGGLGWCLRLGICVGVDYTYNLRLHSNDDWVNYSEHVFIFSISYRTPLTRKEKQ
jgi:hypothetical protein